MIEIISSDGLNIEDVFREIDPFFKKKNAMKRNKDDDHSWAKRCLQAWFKENLGKKNPDKYFLCAVYDAFIKIHKCELARKLQEKFPNHLTSVQESVRFTRIQLEVLDTAGEVESQPNETSVDTSAAAAPFTVKEHSCTDDSILLIVNDTLIKLKKKETACQKIDQNGGKLDLRCSGVTLDVPAKALKKICKIQVSIFEAERAILLNDDKMAYVSIIELLPHQQEFIVPVRIEQKLHHHQNIGSTSDGQIYFHYGQGSSRNELFDFMGTLKSDNRNFAYKKSVAKLEESSYALQWSSFCYACVTLDPGSVSVAVSLFTKRFESEWELQVYCSCGCNEVIEQIKQDMINDRYILSETKPWKFKILCSNEVIRIELHDACASMDAVTVDEEIFHNVVRSKEETPWRNKSKRIKNGDLLSNVSVIGRRLRIERPFWLLRLFSKEKEVEIESYHWTVRRPTQSDIDHIAKRHAIDAPKHKDDNPFIGHEIVGTAASDTAVNVPYRLNREPTSAELSVLSKELARGPWMFVARALEVEECKIQEIKRNNPSELRECIYQVLLTWRENSEDATAYKLCLVLIEEDMTNTARKVFEYGNKSVNPKC